MIDWVKPAKISGVAWDAVLDGAGVSPFAEGLYRATLLQEKTDHPLVEVKKNFTGYNTAALLLVIGEDGWDYKYEKREGDYGRSTKGHQVRLSANGSLALRLEDLENLHAVAGEALAVLASLRNLKTDPAFSLTYED